MNVERLRLLADAIEQAEHVDLRNKDPYALPSGLPTQFNMSEWRCDTAACIGGWAAALFADSRSYNIHETREALGLDESQGQELFFPDSPGGLRYSQVTPAMAATVIRHLAETGDVDWSLIAPQVPA